MPRARVFSFTSSTSSFSSSLSSTSSTTGNSSSDPDDDDDEDYAGHSRSRKTKTVGAAAAKKPAPAATSRAPLPRGQNILLRVLQRERTGFLSCRQSVRSNQQRLAAVPSGLSFCLQDIVPYCYLTGHVFMGLTVCGQFLLSYKVTVIETGDFNQFSIGSYKYELFFWIYRPHQLLRKYYSRCLFDDHGADNEVTVTMCQWLGTPRTIIVHGSCKYENEDSYVSVMAVPKLGCLDCRRMRDVYFRPGGPGDASSRSAALCITCSLTVHTKYTRAESDPPFEPRINLNCPERLILFTNGLIHMLNVSLELNRPQPQRSTCLDVRYVRRRVQGHEDDPAIGATVPQQRLVQPVVAKATAPTTTTPSPSKPADIVAQIIADFDECETNSTTSTASTSTNNGATGAPAKQLMTSQYFEELLINTLPTAGPPRSVAELRRSNNSRRWITRLAATTSPAKPAEPSSSTTSSTPISSAAASRAYEFSEEPPERYEKISSFRKRRLADKKYEFSEDNSENIIPFAKLRMRRQNMMSGAGVAGGDIGTATSMTATSPHSGVGAQSPSAYAATTSSDMTAAQQQLPHSHRASPSHGFRSPCGSPVGGNRFSIMSPPMSVAASMMRAGSAAAGSNGGAPALYGRSPTYKPFGSSPRYARRFESPASCESPLGGSSIYSPLLLSPRSDADFEVYRPGGVFSAAYAALPLAEVKPSNIFHQAHNISSYGALASADLAKDSAVLVTATSAIAAVALTESAASTPARHDEPLLPDAAGDGATPPLCAKKLLRRFVAVPNDDDDDEDDDRTSVMTSEEDDCISPGYHTSLPVDVHGACYGQMQLVSANALQQRQRSQTPTAVVMIAQHTFDLETLTYHIANRLCSLHGKQYGSFYDWACEPIHICPLSAVLISLLLINFTARDATQPGAEPCLNCANGDRLDCAFHRRHFECRSLFAWNTHSGDWSIIDYGVLAELPASVQRHRNQQPMGGDGSGVAGSLGADADDDSASERTTTGIGQDLAACARRLARELQAAPPSSLPGIGGRRDRRKRTTTGSAVVEEPLRDDVSWTMAGLHTLDSCTERSKDFLRDQYNAIEFVRGTAAVDRTGGGSERLHDDSGLVQPTAAYLAGLMASSSDNSDWE